MSRSKKYELQTRLVDAGGDHYVDLLQESIGHEQRPLSWMVGDQGIYRPNMPAQRDIKLVERKAQTTLRSPDAV